VLLTKNRIAIISEADEPAIAGYSWCFNNGYAARCVARPLNEREVRGRQKMIFMHRVILRIEDGFEVDHKELHSTTPPPAFPSREEMNAQISRCRNNGCSKEGCTQPIKLALREVPVGIQLPREVIVIGSLA
jgi:hypothetical protein